MSKARSPLIKVPDGKLLELFYLSNIIIPVATIIFIGVHHQYGHEEYSWPMITVFGVGLSPFILCLFGAYVTKIGNVELASNESGTVMAPESIEATNVATRKVTHSSTSTADLPHYNSLAPEERKIMRTLWRFQRQSFGDNEIPRWGFNIRSTPDNLIFFRGTVMLTKNMLVDLSKQGLVALTVRGYEFCKKYRSELEGTPLPGEDAWTDFSPIQ